MDARRKEIEVEIAWEMHKYLGQTNIRIFNPELRDRLAEAQNWRCCYCGLRLEKVHPNRATIEHVIPLSRGGPDKAENMVIACRRCNGRRGNAMMAIHFEALRYSDLVFDPLCRQKVFDLRYPLLAA